MDFGEQLTALVSSQVSAVDNIAHDVQIAQPSAFLDTLGDFMHRMMNRITVPSVVLISGGSAGSVAVGKPVDTVDSATAVIAGLMQNQPFSITAELSAQPGSAIATTSTQIRKSLVVLTLSALPLSQFVQTAGTLTFVHGSAVATAGGSAASGGVSQFDSVPLPIPSGSEIALGWLNVPNSFALSAGITSDMMHTDYRQTQGFNLELALGTRQQP